jgi:pimeloyl-ACP methyl ester carboxylesterase
VDIASVESAFPRYQRHALEAGYAVQQGSGRPDIVTEAADDSIRTVHDIDAWNLGVLVQLCGDLRSTRAVDGSQLVGHHRTPEIIAAGASVGAFNALASVCRYPHLFRAAVCMSATYHVEQLSDSVGESWAVADTLGEKRIPRRFDN